MARGLLAVFAAVLAVSCAAATVELIAPEKGSLVALVPDAQKKVMSLPTLDERLKLFAEDRKSGKKLRHDPFWRKAKPFVLKWRGTDGAKGPWKVVIGTKADLSDARTWYIRAKKVDAATERETDADRTKEGFFGMPKSVTAVGATGIVSKGGVDHVVATYDYGDGTLVMAEGGWAAAKGVPFEMSFTIVCEKATLKLDASGYRVYPVKGKAITPKLDVKAGPTGWHQELAYFVNCVAKGVKPDKYQTLDSVADTMKLVFAEEKSVKTHKPVRI